MTIVVSVEHEARSNIATNEENRIFIS